MNKVILPRQKAITIFLVFALGYYISNLLRAITTKMGNLTIKSKINRETEVPSEKVNLYIPPEKCCVYEDEKLI